ncbi:MAG: SET domain-containing protein-lysine N-methyltransferase [Waddliaceae bacterium]
MFFWTDQHETPLTTAVIHRNLKAVERLGQHVDHRFAKNYLGFNGIEMARYLGDKECTKILEPQRKRQFHILLRGEKSIRTIREAEYENCLHFTYQPHLTFAGYDVFKQVIHDCPYKNVGTFSEMEIQEILSHQSLEEMTKQQTLTPEILAIHSRLYQEKINKGFFADTAIKWIDDVLGYGVFTNQDLKAGDYIGEYTGAIKLYYRFPFGKFFDLNEYCYVYPRRLLSRRSFIIDPKASGNEMRFVNHSSYEPLLVPKLVVDRRLTHIIFVAGVDISKGTQLTYDYGEDYWRRRDPPLDI